MCCMCVCMYVCVYVCMYVCVCVYVCMYVVSLYHLIAGVFARKMHSTTKFAMTVLSKCVTHAGFVMVAWTLRGIPFHHESVFFFYMFDLRPTSTTTVPRLQRLRCLAPHTTCPGATGWYRDPSGWERSGLQFPVTPCLQFQMAHLDGTQKKSTPLMIFFPVASCPSKTGIHKWPLPTHKG